MEGRMGGKSHTNNQTNRPESGGTDRDEMNEKSGLLDREKEAYAVAEKAKREESTRQQHVEQKEKKEGEEATDDGTFHPPADDS
jgi:hypothetical protein